MMHVERDQKQRGAASLHRKLVIVLTATFAMVLGGLAGLATLNRQTAPAKFEAVDVTGIDWGRHLELTDHQGRKRTLQDFQGKVVVLYFGYIHCPDMCPTALAAMAAAVRRLGPEADKVQGLFVTVDPERDTPEILSQYVTAFHPRFLGLRGDEQATRSAAKEFKVFFERQKPNEHGGYTVDHSVQMFVLDSAGRLRLVMRPDSTVEAMEKDIRVLLRESGA